MPVSEGTAMLISGLASAGISGAQMASNVAKTKRGYSRQRRMMERQNAINIDNWSRQNEYNSPQAQMERFRAAGLNPNLIYQNGGAMTAAGEIGNPTGGSVDTAGVLDNVPEAASQMMMIKANYDSVVAAKENTLASTNLSNVTKAIKDKELSYTDRLLYQQYVGQHMQNLMNYETARNLQQKTQLTKREVDSFYINLQNTLANSEVQRAVGRAGIREVEAKIKQINSLISKTDNENQLLKLEYLRGSIAYEIEKLTADWKKQYHYFEKIDENGNVISSGHERNIDKMLYNEMERLEVEIIGQKLSNVSNPIKDIAIGIAGTAAMLSGSKWFQRKKKIGF